MNLPRGLSGLTVFLFALRADDSVFKPIVRPDVYLENIKALTADKMGGRGSGSENLDRAADFIAKRFESFGLHPKMQPFVLTSRARLGSGNRLQFTVNGQTQSRKSSREFVALPFSGVGKAAGAVVFAGYGITAPEYGYDDYAGVDVRGKIVLVLRQEPQEYDDYSAFEGRSYTAHSQLANKALNARQHGAKGVIFVTPMFSRGSNDDRLEPFVRSAGPGDVGIPVIQMRAADTNAWFERAGHSLDDIGRDIDRDLQPRSFAFPAGVSVAMEVDIERRSREVRNVYAYLPGETDEYVIIGAHYDHLGSGEQFSLGTPGVTHPGADDNASGTSGVIELARWFSQRPGRLKRGILFLTFAGEEIGLLGSSYYVNHPALPLQKAVAMINLDMIGRIRDGKVFVISAGVRGVVEPLVGKYPGLKPDLSGSAGYGASDHTSFTGKGVPILFFFSGLHGDYHKPSDTWDKIDAGATATLLSLVADTMTVLGNQGRDVSQ
ncbi:hypothetical protein F183_A13210 [Bryobacterales bacterium F-183]|nr:hypothetical protein F183_A13210 [Bryobacterales bacterium F-183]